LPVYREFSVIAVGGATPRHAVAAEICVWLRKPKVLAAKSRPAPTSQPRGFRNCRVNAASVERSIQDSQGIAPSTETGPYVAAGTAWYH
jgi:hypothetical protein